MSTPVDAAIELLDIIYCDDERHPPERAATIPAGSL
jgi:hypothetical protein